MLMSQSFGGASNPFSLLLPAASCLAWSAQPLPGAWTDLNHTASNMFLLKIIVIINALSFIAAIWLCASHSAFFPLNSSKWEEGGKQGQRQLLGLFPAPLFQLAGILLMGTRRRRAGLVFRDSKRHWTSSEKRQQSSRRCRDGRKVVTHEVWSLLKVQR